MARLVSRHKDELRHTGGEGILGRELAQWLADDAQHLAWLRLAADRTRVPSPATGRIALVSGLIPLFPWPLYILRRGF